MSSFVGLHIHSDYSLLDGASQLQQLVERAAELGMEAIALTDHGVMYGAIQLIKVCRNKGIKPIIGNEMYVVNGPLEKTEIKRRKYHQVVLAKNTQGYKNLVKLTTISHLKGFQGKGIFARPCINKELLEQYHEGLIVTSACLGGEVPQAILQGKLDIAEKTAKWYKDLFGDDYYLEIQDHGYQEDRIVNVEIFKIAQKLNIKLVVTNDSHFTSCYDVEAHDALLCINTQKLISEEKRMRYSGTEYLKTAEEMAQLFQDHLPPEVIQQAIANTVEVARKVQHYDLFNEPRLPNYTIPLDHTPATYLEQVTWEGLQERLNVKSRAEIHQIYSHYEDRLKYELQMIEQMGFSTYFLVVWDYIKFARDHDIPVGPGRGSAAGSLVAYALKITNIDPVHHGLLFERFLNPERKSMPDIDTDFCIDRRDEVIKYVTEKYGEDCVAQIITFNRMTSKAVLKDVARVLDIPYKKADEMAKMIPVSRGKPTKLKVMISDESPAPEFKKAYEDDPDVRRWLDMAIRIEGTNKTFGVHAAGVVISKDPLDQIVPLQRNNEGATITQYYMEDLDSLGLLKMDFLGLKNLTMIQKTVELVRKTRTDSNLTADAPLADIRKSQETYIRMGKWPRDVEKTYKILELGDLEGIFQLESSGMLDVVKKLKPSSLEDLSSILALYRPGPLDAGLIPLFIDRKHGREPIQYDHPMLESILQETYGVLCYQEQIMKMAQDLAGYSLGEADILRRCLSGSTQLLDVATGKLVSLKAIAKSPEYWLGRKVFSLNLNTQKIEPKPITEIHNNGVQKVWEISTKTGRKIQATKDHLFYSLWGWKPLSSFKVGERIGLTKTLPIIHTSNISVASFNIKTIQDQGKSHISYGAQITEREEMLKFCDLIQPYFSQEAKWPQAQACYLKVKDQLKNQSKQTLSPEVILLIDENLQAIADSDVFWDEIISIEYVGIEEVFDLTISDHHNLIANDFIAHNCMGKKKADEMQKQRSMFVDGATKKGISSQLADKLFDQMVNFAEYCFNKSHSTAYAYVTYQTAYLKANYPVEYMAALLTANSGDQDKVQKYIANCQKSKIEVEPPDINRSDVDFTPFPLEITGSDKHRILFGFSAIKNIGEAAILHILQVRKEGGEFKSLADLCDRVNLSMVNKRALESLIYCGAFDKLQPNRNQLIHDLEGVIKWAQDRNKDRDTGQGNLFDLLGTMNGGTSKNGFESAPKHPTVPDFTQKEKLQWEKDLLGFYVSEHPLKAVLRHNTDKDTITLNQLPEKKGKTVKVIVMLTTLKPHVTKKGERMAFVQFEDITGQSEAVIFPKTYAEIQDLLIPNTILVITGKVDKREEEFQILVDHAQSAEELMKTAQLEPVEPIYEAAETLLKAAVMVMLKLTPRDVTDETLQKIQLILEEYKGSQANATVPVVATITGESEQKQVKFGQQFWIEDGEAAVNRFQNSGFDACLTSSNSC